MKTLLTSVAALAICSGGAIAAGVERSSQSVGILFETGRYAEFSFGSVKPKVSGTQALTLSAGSPAGAKSGDIAGDYTLLGFGYKQALGDKMDLAIVLDTPVGANTDYAALTGYVYGGTIGSKADLTSRGVNLLGRYKVNDRFSIIGGARIIRTEGEVNLFSGYSLSTKPTTDVGYVFGVAYERPEIAMRVALTYNSAVEQTFDATETSVGAGLANVAGQFTTTIPKSWNLEFQSGIAKDTLLFGSIRWVQWSKYDITPPLFAAADGNGFGLVELNDDITTYNLGLGRRFNDTWSGAVTASYERATGGFSGNLSPTDGKKSLGLAATYTKDNMKITGGISYIWIGDAKTQVPVPAPAPKRTESGATLGNFTDNSAVAVGFKIGFSF